MQRKSLYFFLFINCSLPSRQQKQFIFILPAKATLNVCDVPHEHFLKLLANKANQLPELNLLCYSIQQSILAMLQSFFHNRKLDHFDSSFGLSPIHLKAFDQFFLPSGEIWLGINYQTTFDSAKKDFHYFQEALTEYLGEILSLPIQSYPLSTDLLNNDFWALHIQKSSRILLEQYLLTL